MLADNSTHPFPASTLHRLGWDVSFNRYLSGEQPRPSRGSAAGIWVLVFSTLDYLRLFDLGFRAAIINFTARCRARNDEGA